MPRLGVLGWPVSHSRSPAMHNAALRELGLDDWHYQRLPVPPELFAETTWALPGAGFAGANVTIPHKRAALELADDASETARAIGAANTLCFAPDGTIGAENTDAPGLIAALPRAPAGLRALVLGAGGSARAAVWALREAGASEVSVWNRTASRAYELAAELGVRAVEAPVAADLLVNCTSVGLHEPAPAAHPRHEPALAAHQRHEPAPRGPREPPREGEQPAHEAHRSPAHDPPQPTPPAGAGGAERAGGVERSASEDCALNQLGLTFDQIGDYTYVADLVYRSTPTPLLVAAAAHGAQTVDGLEILLAQGALSLRLWTGCEPPLDVMRRAARDPGGG